MDEARFAVYKPVLREHHGHSWWSAVNEQGYSCGTFTEQEAHACCKYLNSAGHRRDITVAVSIARIQTAPLAVLVFLCETQRKLRYLPSRVLFSVLNRIFPSPERPWFMSLPHLVSEKRGDIRYRLKQQLHCKT